MAAPILYPAPVVPPVLLNGDCLEWIPRLPAKGVDLVLADLPYGKLEHTDTSLNRKITAMDRALPVDELWRCFRHVLKDAGCAVVFASQPYASQLIVSNLKWFRYEMIWDTCSPSGYLNVRHYPMRSHQNILIFSPKGHPTYNPIMEAGKPYRLNRTGTSAMYGSHIRRCSTDNSGLRYPKSVIKINRANTKGQHPFEKPLSLGEWLLTTFSNDGDVVLDPTMGSGTFGVAGRNLNRSFIGIERDTEWFIKARDRILRTVI